MLKRTGVWMLGMTSACISSSRTWPLVGIVEPNADCHLQLMIPPPRHCDILPSFGRRRPRLVVISAVFRWWKCGRSDRHPLHGR